MRKDYVRRESNMVDLYLVKKIVFRLLRPFYKVREEKAFKYGIGKPVISHVTYYVSGNSGDTTLSRCVRECFDFLYKRTAWRLFLVKNQVTDRTVSEINSSRSLVIGGGGLFLPDTNNNEISGWQWAIDKDKLSSIKVPVIVFSVGYNYFPGQIPSELFIDNLCRLVEKSVFFGLRNYGSVNSVKSLLPDNLKDKVVFQPCTTTLIRKINPNLSPKKRETKTIAVNMAFDREEIRYGKNKELILNQVAQACRKINMDGYSILYAMHCKDDGKFIKYLDANGVKYKAIDMSLWFPKKTIEFYNNVDMVIGMRGHAQMIPFGVNCEIISLGTHSKMKWFLEDIDCLDWYVDLTDNVEKLSDIIYSKFIDIHVTNSDKTIRRLIEKQNYLWEVTKSNFESINSVL